MTANTARQADSAERQNARAVYMPQGFCPKQWCAYVNGEPLRTVAGGLKRYSTEASALRAAKASAQ